MLLHRMLAYLMLLAALFNAVCLNNTYFLSLSFEMLFVFMLCPRLLTHSLLHSLFQILFCIMHIAFNQLVFLILCSHHCLSKGYQEK